jgi:RimJ/RimL family protein N-acetyltransferase
MINNNCIFSYESKSDNYIFKEDPIGTKETLNDINSVSKSLPKNEFVFIGAIKKFTKDYVLCESVYNNDKCVGFALFTKTNKLKEDDEILVPNTLSNDIKFPILNIYLATKHEARGKHLSQQLINKAIPHLKQMGYNKICWSAWFENIASRKAAISCGFKEVGISKYPTDKDGSHIFIREI